MFNAPQPDRTERTAAAISEDRPRSQTLVLTLTPRRSASRAAAARLTSSRSMRKRSAPSRASASANARPMPDAAPVTNAFFPRMTRIAWKALALSGRRCHGAIARVRWWDQPGHVDGGILFYFPRVDRVDDRCAVACVRRFSARPAACREHVREDMSLLRSVEPELLDQMPADDRRAVRARRGLERLHAVILQSGIMAPT